MSTANNIYSEDTVLFTDEMESNFYYIVKRGSVLLFKIDKERVIPVYLAKAGDFLGEDCSIQDVPYYYNAITLEETELVKVSKDVHNQALKEAPDWLHNLLLTLAERVDLMKDAIKDHRILDERLTNGVELTNELEFHIKKKYNEFKKTK